MNTVGFRQWAMRLQSQYRPSGHPQRPAWRHVASIYNSSVSRTVIINRKTDNNTWNQPFWCVQGKVVQERGVDYSDNRRFDSMLSEKRADFFENKWKRDLAPAFGKGLRQVEWGVYEPQIWGAEGCFYRLHGVSYRHIFVLGKWCFQKN